MENDNDKFISLLQQQLLLRKEGIHRRIEKRQKELTDLRDELSTLVKEYNTLNIFQGSRKKILKDRIKECEGKMSKLIEANKKDSLEIKKLNTI